MAASTDVLGRCGGGGAGPDRPPDACGDERGDQAGHDGDDGEDARQHQAGSSAEQKKQGGRCVGGAGDLVGEREGLIVTHRVGGPHSRPPVSRQASGETHGSDDTHHEREYEHHYRHDDHS